MSEGPAAVRFPRQGNRGVLLGLSLLRMLTLGVALFVMALGLFAGNGRGFVLSGLVWAPLVAAAFVRVGGRPVVDWAPLAAEYALRRVTGQTTYRARPGKPRPAGTLALPGDAAALRVYEDPVTGAAMIHDPHARTLTAVLAVEHPAYVLLAPDDQAQRVYVWGRVLAGLANSGLVAALQVLEAVVPDPGTGVLQWYAEHGLDTTGWPSAEYEALLSHVSTASQTHRTTVSLALDMRRAAKAIAQAGRGLRGAAAVLHGEMAGLEQGLRSAGLRVDHWLTAAELAAYLRAAYDPAAKVLPTGPGANLATAGPVAVNEHWDRLRFDSGYGAVLWITEWPRIDVMPHFLHPIVFAPGVRRTFSLLMRPVDAGRALREIRRQKAEVISDRVQKARLGQIEDLADEQEYQDLLAREQALLTGHADVLFTGLVAVTAESEDELAAAVNQIQRAAAQAACDTRVLYGRQAQAYVAAATPIARVVW